MFVVNTSPYCPTALYFAHRRGWSVYSQDLQNQSFLDEIKSKGCKFVLVCKTKYGVESDVVLELPQLFESDYIRIYRLE